MNLKQFPIQLTAPKRIGRSDTVATDNESANFLAESKSLESIDAATLEFWLQIHQTNSSYDSPYYHPEFTRAVAAVRDDVEVAIIRACNDQIVGILPMQRSGKFAADPIGGRTNDFHGIIQYDSSPIELSEMLTQIGAKRFGFHALSTGLAEFRPFAFEQLASYFIDLTDGFKGYHEWLRNHSSTVKRLGQKTRALNRDVGSVKFEFESSSELGLERLIRLKQEKYQRTNTFDILSVDWAANLLREIFRTKRDGFRGLLSALWAGDTMVAAHFGMIAGDVLHYWFPVYDPAYSKYSPGIQLMLQTCRSAGCAGIKRIDLGYGESKFKDRFSNGSSQVLTGVVDCNSATHFAAKQKYFFRKKLKQIPLKENAKAVLRAVFPSYGHWHFK